METDASCVCSSDGILYICYGNAAVSGEYRAVADCIS